MMAFFCATHCTSRMLIGAYPEYTYEMSFGVESSTSSTTSRSDLRRAGNGYEKEEAVDDRRWRRSRAMKSGRWWKPYA